jgi:hypothetical protein
MVTKMKAKITNNTNGPKGFYVGFQHKIIPVGEFVEGDFDEALLVSVENVAGLTVDLIEEKKAVSVEKVTAKKADK